MIEGPIPITEFMGYEFQRRLLKVQSIKDEPQRRSKTAFKNNYNNYYYEVMPFGLKNARVTYINIDVHYYF